MRLRSVRYKDGRAPLLLLHNPDAIDLMGTLQDHARFIAGESNSTGRLDGFIIIGLFDDGSSSIGCRIPERLPSCLIPAYIEELMRRDMVTEPAAKKEFDRNFEWVE